MINIRRRLALPGTQPQPPAVEQQAQSQPVDDQQHAEQRAAPTTRRERRVARDNWADRIGAEGFLWLLAFVVWLGDGFFTIAAIMWAVPWWFIGLPLGAGLHYGVSRCQLYLWHRWRELEYGIPLVLCSIFNIGTTLVGLVGLAVLFAPGALGAAPTSVWAWRTLFTADKVPSWAGNVVPFVVLSIGMAVFSEPLMRRYWRNLQKTWREKH